MDYNNKQHKQPNLTQLKELLSKYWEGETSIAEERTIKQFYRDNPELPQPYESYRMQFDFVSQTKMATVSNNFDKRLLEKINEPVQPQSAKVVSFGLKKILSIAAMLIMLIGVAIWVPKLADMGSQPQAEVLMTIEKNGKIIEITDPEKALEVTQMAFSAINRGMKEGNSSLKHIKQFRRTEIIK